MPMPTDDVVVPVAQALDDAEPLKRKTRWSEPEKSAEPTAKHTEPNKTGFSDRAADDAGHENEVLRAFGGYFSHPSSGSQNISIVLKFDDYDGSGHWTTHGKTQKITVSRDGVDRINFSDGTLQLGGTLDAQGVIKGTVIQNFERGGFFEVTEQASEARLPKLPRPPEAKYDHRRTTGEVRRCKKGKRTDIKPDEWDKYGYALRPEVLTAPIVYDEQTIPIQRVKRKDITPEQFYERFAKLHIPVIVEDCTEDWPANNRWSLDALEERFRQVGFKVAKDDNGKKLRMKFKYFADYIRKQQDDSPLYLFETNADDNANIRPLLADYEVPDLFPHDWFSLINRDARPPHLWFCIGPKRSGTTVHNDPLGTSAWNAVTHGVKRWVLFKPEEAKRVVKGRDVIAKGEDDEAINYFDYILPRIKKKYPDLKVWEGLQRPGEVIFVPGEWWHGVLNLEDSVAITQNYCGPDNFEMVWKHIRKEREKIAYLWLRNMRRFAPALATQAEALNARDKFRMRHERAPGEKLEDCSSSSSESSSDSAPDEAGDLSSTGLEACGHGLALGGDAWRCPGLRRTRSASPPTRIAGGNRAGFRNRSTSREHSRKRRRRLHQEQATPQAAVQEASEP